MARLADIRDQRSATDRLRRAVACDRVPHAYLFEGQPGVGKRLAATALAMTMNCEEKGDDACGECGSCGKVDRGIHPDVRWLGLPEGKRRIPIDSVREAERWLRISPHEGAAKFLLIDPAEMMSEQAANALLKTLEEPRAGSFLVLVTGASSALLPTIRSRCQTVRFGPLTDETVADLLLELGLADEENGLVAALSGGSMERAQSLAGDNLQDRMDAVVALLDGATAMLPGSALGIAATLRGDRDEVLAVLELLLFVLDELLWRRSGDSGDGSSRGDLVARLDGRLEELGRSGSPSMTARHIAAVNRAMVSIKRNNMNPQLAVEGMVMAMRGRDSLGEDWARIGAR